jgi:four helix bundle protein
MKICHKELNESARWLCLIQRVPLLTEGEAGSLLAETEELTRIFASSIRTAEKNRSATK